MEIFENHLIAPYTTINLGGRAKIFCVCHNEDDVKECLTISFDKKYPVKVISGGSNIIFPDEGYDGIIMKISGEKITVVEDNKENQIVEVWAGTEWDKFVKWSIDNSLSGIECLSGIPGSCGATAIQNVGAYGQEVNSVIKKVVAFDFANNEYKIFKNADCEFGYRTSVFKKDYKNKLIILKVYFELSKNKIYDYTYPDLKKEIEKCEDYNKFNRLEKLKFIRNSIYKIRKNKSMIYDKSDPDSISCGSFFLNPVLTQEQFKRFYNLSQKKNLNPPYFKINSNYKIPAAFLIENSGFYRGYIKNGAGISKKHSLALVNYGCETKSLLKLVEEIKERVKCIFGITLEIEPEIVFQ